MCFLSFSGSPCAFISSSPFSSPCPSPLYFNHLPVFFQADLNSSLQRLVEVSGFLIPFSTFSLSSLTATKFSCLIITDAPYFLSPVARWSLIEPDSSPLWKSEKGSCTSTQSLLTGPFLSLWTPLSICLLTQKLRQDLWGFQRGTHHLGRRWWCVSNYVVLFLNKYLLFIWNVEPYFNSNKTLYYRIPPILFLRSLNCFHS